MKISPILGSSLYSAADTAINYMLEHADVSEVEIDFNGITLKAVRGQTREQIVADFDEKNVTRHEAWKMSPEGQAFIAEMDAKTAAAQAKHDRLLPMLATAVESSSTLVKWLFEYASAVSFGSVTKDVRAVAAVMTSKGYVANDLVGAVIQSDEEFRRYIIGQAVSQFERAAGLMEFENFMSIMQSRKPEVFQ
jgi:hypothetical protein